jgi:hypothetical protein
MYKVIRKSDATVRHIAPNKVALNYVTKKLSGTTHEMRGTFKAVMVNQPAFGSR